MLMTLLTGVLRGEERREQSTWLGLTAVNCSELCSLWYWELQQLFDTNLILPSSNSIHKRSKICKNLLAFSFKKPITERLQRSAIVKIKRLLKQRYIILEKKKTKLVYAIELWFLCNRFRTIVENVRDVADILRVFSQRDPGTRWSDSAALLRNDTIMWPDLVTGPGSVTLRHPAQRGQSSSRPGCRKIRGWGTNLDRPGLESLGYWLLEVLMWDWDFMGPQTLARQFQEIRILCPYVSCFSD